MPEMTAERSANAESKSKACMTAASLVPLAGHPHLVQARDTVQSAKSCSTPAAGPLHSSWQGPAWL